MRRKEIKEQRELRKKASRAALDDHYEFMKKLKARDPNYKEPSPLRRDEARKELEKMLKE